MARIIFSGLVTEIRGSAGGTTFQRNAYGYTLKNKPSQVVPNRSSQRSWKSRFARCLQAWRNLTEVNRAAWNAYAEVNEIPSRHNPESYLNGFNAFVRHKLYNDYISTTPLANPSASIESPNYSSVVVTRSGGDLNVQVNSSSSGGTWNVALKMTRKLGSAQNVLKGWLKFIAADSEATWNATVDVADAYNAIFGALPESGDRLGVQPIFVNAGNGQVLEVPNEIVVVA